MERAAIIECTTNILGFYTQHFALENCGTNKSYLCDETLHLKKKKKKGESVQALQKFMSVSPHASYDCVANKKVADGMQSKQKDS